MDISQMNWIFQSLAERNTPARPDGPGKLLTVLPLLKTSVVDGFEYELTHAMQHEHGSIVFLEINRCQLDESIGPIFPHLLLEVNGGQEYSVRRNGSHSLP
ncbi:hypothetical protein ACFFK0_22160 [Paenibacillus chartarius]|uniref:Uncharacterized protein n=1 Tax=Paenibacillus chartarius TaxID=747481 RepID=A0ABV6DR37_9BACL